MQNNLNLKIVEKDLMIKNLTNDIEIFKREILILKNDNEYGNQQFNKNKNDLSISEKLVAHLQNQLLFTGMQKNEIDSKENFSALLHNKLTDLFRENSILKNYNEVGTIELNKIKYDLEISQSLVAHLRECLLTLEISKNDTSNINNYVSILFTKLNEIYQENSRLKSSNEFGNLEYNKLTGDLANANFLINELKNKFLLQETFQIDNEILNNEIIRLSTTIKCLENKFKEEQTELIKSKYNLNEALSEKDDLKNQLEIETASSNRKRYSDDLVSNLKKHKRRELNCFTNIQDCPYCLKTGFVCVNKHIGHMHKCKICRELHFECTCC